MGGSGLGYRLAEGHSSLRASPSLSQAALRLLPPALMALAGWVTIKSDSNEAALCGDCPAGDLAGPVYTQRSIAQLLRKTLLPWQGGQEPGDGHTVPGVTNSKKHFIITLQHINSSVKSVLPASWAPRPPGSCLPSHCTVHGVALALGPVGEAANKGPAAAQSHSGSRPAPVICLGCGWCASSAPRGSGQQRRGAAGPLPT